MIARTRLSVTFMRALPVMSYSLTSGVKGNVSCCSGWLYMATRVYPFRHLSSHGAWTDTYLVLPYLDSI